MQHERIFSYHVIWSELLWETSKLFIIYSMCFINLGISANYTLEKISLTSWHCVDFYFEKDRKSHQQLSRSNNLSPEIVE